MVDTTFRVAGGMCHAGVAWAVVGGRMAETMRRSPGGAIDAGARVRRLAAGNWLWQALAMAVVSAVASAQPADQLPLTADTAVDAGDLWRFDDPGLDDEACMAELRRCCCCPSWDHYAIFDVLFLQRANLAGNQPLFINADTGAPVLTAQDLQAGVAPGVRLFYGRLVTDHLGWEVGYTGIYGMFGQAGVTGNDNLSFPDALGDEFPPANAARATWASSLNIAEANLFLYDCCEECGPCCRQSCHCSSWLVGFVWAGLAEQSSLTVLCCDPPEPSTYAVRTNTNYFGPQIGQWGRREWCRWAIDGWWKAAVCGTSAYQAQDPIVSSVTGPVRPGESARDSGVGFIGGLNGSLIYRLTDVWGIRAGYNCYWLTNAALAPTQYDFGAFENNRINDNGVLFLHGANLGVEARW
jgi:hypothetical protein